MPVCMTVCVFYRSIGLWVSDSVYAKLFAGDSSAVSTIACSSLWLQGWIREA